MSLRRRLEKVERDRRGGERVFVSTMDAGLGEEEQEAFKRSERERLGIKASKTTALMTGEEGLDALKKASAVAEAYRPAR